MPMFLVERPLAAPYKCKSCGGVTKKWYIDTGTLEEFYGAVYYCNECFTHMANLAGFLSIEQSEVLQKGLEELTTKYNVLVEYYNELMERGPREIRPVNSVFNRIVTYNPAQLRVLEDTEPSNEPVQSGTTLVDTREERPPDNSEDSTVADVSDSKQKPTGFRFG